MDFTNKTAIVTGAGQGIGFEICRRLACAGAYVTLNDLDPALADEAAHKINAETPGHCMAVPGDSSDPDLIRELIDCATAPTGQLDIAIANAGITLFGDFLTYTRAALLRVLEVNLAGTFLLAQAAANTMKDQENGGSLLFLSSAVAHQAHPDLAAYSMTKAGIEMLAKNLVVELSQYQINVNTVAPGATLTERTLGDPTYEDAWSKLTPLGRPGTTTDVAHAALFLVSDEARLITGQSLVVDGGWTSISPAPK